MNRSRRALLGAVLATAAGLAAAPVAGADTTQDAGLGPYHRQHVDWRACQRGPDDGDGRALDEAGVQCADIRVPLDYSHPGGRAITVAIARSKATDTAHYAGPLLFNLGGPATPVLSTVPLARQGLGVTGAKFDVIGMDVRFSGRSSPIDCGWQAGWLPRSAGTDRESFDRMVALSKDLADRCARTNADVLPYASTADAARDMDVVRAALGAPKLSFLGYSQGSYLGAQYLQRFGGRAGRVVLDSAIDPDRPGVTILSDRTAASRRAAALGEWAALAAQHDDLFHLGTTAEQVLATVDRVYRAAADTPLRVGPYLVDDTVVPALVLGLLVDDSEESAVELAATVQVLAQAADTGGAEPTQALSDTLAGQLTGRESAQHSAATAVQCGDAPVSRDVEAYWRDIEAARTGNPLFGPLGNNITPCAFWPNPPRERPVRVRNGTPALVVQAAGEVNAVLEMGQAMHRALSGSRMITLEGARDHGVYLFRGSDCVDTAVNAYLDTGNLPTTDLTCTQ
ncbi:alpha/beta hydrolase [Umezawaea tangerina]|uniref:Alpha/beta hydrolase family protein n=1 Tax=Umezawaea tangerina TaxID=84725 RepID=A0A2T0T241_9PSEU|nr:alpha/beta hydrolase [Umezawaea tangerina]PRY39714.1 alpha/beta hydrolase family protein [Umezawaea tangerina]